MATVYNVNMRIVSDFCNYSEDELEGIIVGVIKSYVDERSGLKLRLSDITTRKES